MRISQKVKWNVNVDSSTYYFHMKTKILAIFQISISVPLNNFNVSFVRKALKEKMNSIFMFVYKEVFNVTTVKNILG